MPMSASKCQWRRKKIPMTVSKCQCQRQNANDSVKMLMTMTAASKCPLKFYYLHTTVLWALRYCNLVMAFIFYFDAFICFYWFQSWNIIGTLLVLEQVLPNTASIPFPTLNTL
jgi:hypothetical protein